MLFGKLPVLPDLIMQGITVRCPLQSSVFYSHRQFYGYICIYICIYIYMYICIYIICGMFRLQKIIFQVNNIMQVYFTFLSVLIPCAGGRLMEWHPRKYIALLSYLLSFFILFFVITSVYLLLVGIEGYCCTWSHSLTHTHARARSLGRTPLDEG